MKGDIEFDSFDVFEPFVLDYLSFNIFDEKCIELILEWYCINKNIQREELILHRFYSNQHKRKITDKMIYYIESEKGSELSIASSGCRDLFDKLIDLYEYATKSDLKNGFCLKRFDLKMVVNNRFFADELENRLFNF